MADRSVTLLAVLLLAVAAVAPVVAVPTQSMNASTSSGADATGANANANDSASFGASVSAFMQTSAVDAENEVEAGVFTARFRNASNETQRTLVEGRVDAIAERIEELREQRQALLDREGNLTVSERARAAALAARIDALRNTIERTDAAATEAGVNVTRLDEFRNETDGLDGPEIAEMARGLAGGPYENRGEGNDGERGPPDVAGPPDGNETESPESDLPGDAGKPENPGKPDDPGNPDGPDDPEPTDTPEGNETTADESESL